MTDSEWQETIVAGMLFAALTRDFSGSQREDALNLESVAINHGKLSLEMRDGKKFEIAIRLMPE